MSREVAYPATGRHPLSMPVRPPLSIAVEAEWDAEAEVWVATSDEVPGLVAEHRDLAVLQAMVVELVPILLVENGLIKSGEGTRMEA